MSSDTRRNCPAHRSSGTAEAVATDCNCGLRAARAAVAMRPIPKEAVRTGATFAASLALRRAGLGDLADQLLHKTGNGDSEPRRPAAAARLILGQKQRRDD